MLLLLTVYWVMPCCVMSFHICVYVCAFGYLHVSLLDVWADHSSCWRLFTLLLDQEEMELQRQRIREKYKAQGGNAGMRGQSLYEGSARNAHWDTGWRKSGFALHQEGSGNGTVFLRYFTDIGTVYDTFFSCSCPCTDLLWSKVFGSMLDAVLFVEGRCCKLKPNTAKAWCQETIIYFLW